MSAETPQADTLPPPLNDRPLGTTDQAEAAVEFLHRFDIGPLHGLLPRGIPAALAVAGNIRRLPFSPPWFEGLTNYHGEIIPVFDLAPFLESGNPAGRGRFLLVIGEKNGRAALRADQVTTFPLAQAAALTDDYRGPAALRGLVTARYRWEDGDYLLLDPLALLEAMRLPAAGTA
jgi:chemotaxis signal transduction protein